MFWGEEQLGSNDSNESGESEWEVDENGNYIKKIPPIDQRQADAKPKLTDEDDQDTHSASVVPKLTQPYMYSKLVDSFHKMNAAIAELEIEWTGLNNKIDSKAKQMAQLVSLRSNSIHIFGDEMVALMSMIDNNRNRFIKRPKGPLGACISVRSASWVPLIEHILYPYLFIFIVDNRYDHNVLVKMIDEVYDSLPASFPASPFDAMRKPDVWITQFRMKKRNIFDARVPIGLGYTTLLDMLEFRHGDPDIFNTLHDFIRIEKIVLFNNEHDAFLRMANSFRLPRNCQIGYTKNFMKVIPYPHFRTISLYNPATTFLNAVWPARSRVRGGGGPRSFESAVASSDVARSRLKICQMGVKQLSSLMQLQFQPAGLRPSVSSAPPPNLIKLASNEEFDLMKASQFYLLPSLGPTIEALQDEINNLVIERKIHVIIMKMKRETRLNVLSQIELVKEQLEINESSEF